MDSPLLKYSAKEYFFKAALCHFCIDMLNAKVGGRERGVGGGKGGAGGGGSCRRPQPQRGAVLQLAVQKYEEMFPAFTDSRECKLVKVSAVGPGGRPAARRGGGGGESPPHGSPICALGWSQEG